MDSENPPVFTHYEDRQGKQTRGKHAPREQTDVYDVAHQQAFLRCKHQDKPFSHIFFMLGADHMGRKKKKSVFC